MFCQSEEFPFTKIWLKSMLWLDKKPMEDMFWSGLLKVAWDWPSFWMICLNRLEPQNGISIIGVNLCVLVTPHQWHIWNSLNQQPNLIQVCHPKFSARLSSVVAVVSLHCVFFGPVECKMLSSHCACFSLPVGCNTVHFPVCLCWPFPYLSFLSLRNHWQCLLHRKKKVEFCAPQKHVLQNLFASCLICANAACFLLS